MYMLGTLELQNGAINQYLEIKSRQKYDKMDYEPCLIIFGNHWLRASFWTIN